MPKLAPEVLKIPVPAGLPPRGRWGRWMFAGGGLDESQLGERTHPWYRVIWLTGVDYFSDLGFQPGITLLAAGALALPATALLVLLTLAGAVPLYAQVARRSYAGQGSIAMLEHLLPGWAGKIFVLALLGFAGTDFLITMTLSAADAARHAVANAWLHPYIGGERVAITLLLLLLLAAVFLAGFRQAIEVSILVAVPYLILNLIVLLVGLAAVMRHPAGIQAWRLALFARGGWTQIFIASALIFPRLALGLGGFETGVSVMPLIRGANRETAREKSGPPLERIHNTRKLLLSAGVIMGALLLLSSFVCPLLIPPAAYRLGGPASGRAIAYLAHRLLGAGFGAIYDLFSILILWFAGASAMAGLLSLLPRYLPRFGMAPRWVAYRRPLVLALLALDGLITWIFHAGVNAQAGAYATGVLVLMLSAGIAVSLALGHEARAAHPQRARLALLLRGGYFWLVTLVFAYTLTLNIAERPDGVIIASCLILLLLTLGGISRYHRATEMRITQVRFADLETRQVWEEVSGRKVNLVPTPHASPEVRHALAAKLSEHFRLEGPLCFVHVRLLDNRSEFLAPLRVWVRAEGAHYVLEAEGAVAVANSIAYLSQLLDPRSLVLGLTHKNLMKQSLQYMFLGQGEVGLMVYSILVRYWEWAQPAHRPLLFLLSE